MCRLLTPAQRVHYGTMEVYNKEAQGWGKTVYSKPLLT